MKSIRILRWFLINGVMAALLWFGFGPDQIDGARYLYTFNLGFFVFIVSLVVFSDDLLKTAREKPRPVPTWMCVSYDVLSIAFLVWLGHWFLGLLIVWEVLCLAHIFNLPAKEATA